MIEKTKVLFVCMGNICRSPSAQGVFEKLVAEKGLQNKFVIDSAGTHSYHVGGRADNRSQHFATARGINLAKQRARKVVEEDFEKFDYVIAMDDENYFNLQKICPIYEHQVKIYKMMSFTSDPKFTEVPDPYYGGGQGFELVLDL